MKRDALLDCVLAILAQAGVRWGSLAHEKSGTPLLIHRKTTLQDATVYRPLLCAYLQGAKEVGTSTRTLTVQAGQSLIVSHALPVVSRITEATQELPYVALVFALDLDVLRAVAPSAPPSSDAGQVTRSRSASRTPMKECRMPLSAITSSARQRRRGA